MSFRIAKSLVSTAHPSPTGTFPSLAFLCLYWLLCQQRLALSKFLELKELFEALSCPQTSSSLPFSLSLPQTDQQSFLHWPYIQNFVCMLIRFLHHCPELMKVVVTYFESDSHKVTTALRLVVFARVEMD